MTQLEHPPGFTLSITLARLSIGQHGEGDWGALQTIVVIAIVPNLVL